MLMDYIYEKLHTFLEHSRTSSSDQRWMQSTIFDELLLSQLHNLAAFWNDHQHEKLFNE